MSRLVQLLLAVCLLAGCAADVELAPDEGPPIEEDEGRFVTDTAVTNVDLDARELSTVRVRAGVLSVWLEPFVSEVRESGVEWVVRGRTSRRLKEVVTFVPEDGFASARILTPTSFEIVITRLHEITALLSGTPLFVRFVTASGVPNEHQARLVIAPRAARVGGASSIRFDGVLRPIATRDKGDGVRWRGLVRTTQTPKWFSLETEDVDRSRDISPTVFQYDLRWHDLVELEVSLMVARAEFASGLAMAHAKVQFAVASLGLTTKSAERTWPPEACRAEVKACVAASKSDYGACGTYREVLACLRR